MCCIHVMLHNPLSANLITIETTKVIFKCFATEPHLAWLLRICTVKGEGLQLTFAIPAQCHGSTLMAFGDRLHYGYSLLGRVDPENRWLALALWQRWVHPQHDFHLFAKGNGNRVVMKFRHSTEQNICPTEKYCMKNNSKNSCHEIAKSMSLISNYYLAKNAVSISFSCALCLLYELYALLFVGNYQISEEGWTYPLQHQHQPILTPSSSDMGALSEKPSHSIIGGYTDSSVHKSQSRI